VAEGTNARVCIGAIGESFLHDCDEAVREAWALSKERLAAVGAQIVEFEAVRWDEAMSIYGPIQGSEAAAIHTSITGGDFSCFPSPVNKLLARGASLAKDEVEQRRMQHAEFRERVDALFEKYDFLLLPCSPMSRLEAGKDHSQTRLKILRYTVPLSLAGTPVVTWPFARGAGMQLVAPRGEDAKLLALAAAHCGST
jgi:aspartyl-tRNA(Asn)/glutamyl-tRNA(Gln) amidotransferase subunit A